MFLREKKVKTLFPIGKTELIVEKCIDLIIPKITVKHN